MKKGIVDDCWLIMQSNYHHSSIYYQVYYNYCELLIMYWKVVLWKILEYVLEGNWRQFLKVLELKNQSAQFSWLTFFKLDIWSHLQTALLGCKMLWDFFQIFPRSAGMVGRCWNDFFIKIQKLNFHLKV